MITNDLLKNRILDDAFHGNLIENDKTLKSVNISEVISDIPYEIPSNWKWIKYSDITESKMGKTILSSDLIESGIPVYSATQGDNIFGYVKESSVLLHKGDIVIPARGNSIGFVTLVKEEIATCTQTTIYSRITNEEILPEFLTYCCKYFREIWFKYSGAAIPQVTVGQINKNLVPVPPQEEQKKIVERVNELFMLIDRKNKNDIEKDKLKIILKEKIISNAINGTLVKNDESLSPLIVPIIKEDKPYELPNNWVWTYLKDISDYGKNKKKNGKDIKDDEWLLELEDIEKDTGRIIKKVLQKERKAVSDKNIFKENDVLYGKLRPYLNKCVIAHESGYCSTEIEPITLIDCVLPEYLHIVMTSKYFLNYVNSCSYGAKMPRLGTKDGQNAMIPLPPLEEQKRIIEKIESLFELIEQL